MLTVTMTESQWWLWLSQCSLSALYRLLPASFYSPENPVHRHHHPHFTDEETESLWGLLTHRRTHRWDAAELGYEEPKSLL